MKKDYVPRYYQKADQSGTRIKPKQHAEEAAKYLAETQWGDWENEVQENHMEPLHTQGIKFNKHPPKYNGGLITSTEVDEAIFKTKNTKLRDQTGFRQNFSSFWTSKAVRSSLSYLTLGFRGNRKSRAKHNLPRLSLSTKKETRPCSRITDQSVC